MDWPTIIWLKAALWEVELRVVAMFIAHKLAQEYVVVSTVIEKSGRFEELLDAYIVDSRFM